jgi:hypothetical protein
MDDSRQIAAHRANAHFDYEQLDRAIAQEARAEAYKTHVNLHRIRDAGWEIGRSFVRARELLGYGLFVKWLEAEFSMSVAMAYRSINLYERLGGEAFLNLRKAQVAVTTLYRLTSKRVPESLRREITAAVESGAINGNKQTVNAEIKRRITAAKALIGESPALTKALAKKLEHRDAGVEAAKWAKSQFAEQYPEFQRICRMAGPSWLFDALTVEAPPYGVGLITGEVINTGTKLRLTDEDLEDYLLDRDTMLDSDTQPPSLPPPDAAPEPDAAPSTGSNRSIPRHVDSIDKLLARLALVATADITSGGKVLACPTEIYLSPSLLREFRCKAGARLAACLLLSTLPLKNLQSSTGKMMLLLRLVISSRSATSRSMARIIRS